jgi:hypothetical protein
MAKLPDNTELPVTTNEPVTIALLINISYI